MEPNMKCPECSGAEVAVEVRTWLNYHEGEPEGFDPEDTDSAEPIPGGACICRECQHQWQWRAE
jgi:hypothetical protein